MKTIETVRIATAPRLRTTPLLAGKTPADIAASTVARSLLGRHASEAVYRHCTTASPRCIPLRTSRHSNTVSR